MNGLAGDRNKFIVMLHQGVDPDQWIAAYQQPGVQDLEAISLIGGFRCTCDQAGQQALQGHPAVTLVEADVPISLTGRSIWQHHRKRQSEVIPDGVQAIRAPEAWPAAQGEGVKVGVIDSGIDLAHADLAPNVAGGLNFLDARSPPQDDFGHGTHVAGTIAAAHNAAGIVGVAPRARLYPLKVLSTNQTGWLSDIIRALQWAIMQGLHVVNISLGTPTHVHALDRAVTNALNAGVLIVTGAGNGGPETVEYPAAIPGVLTVGAVTMSGHAAAFSSTGSHIAVVAPGVKVLSTVPGNRYGTSTGTSMASPHVAGTAALYLELHRSAKPADVRDALERSATTLGGLTRYQQGAGLVNARRALEL